MHNSTISNVTVNGSIRGYQAVGGIAGRILVCGEIKDCTNNASIVASSYNAGGMTGIGYYDNGTPAGGAATRITNCVNNANITVNGVGAGGIVGLFKGDIAGCTNNGAVQGNGTSVGGICGETSGVVQNCINNGAVSNNSSGAYGTGGIVGWIRSNHPTENNDDFNYGIVPVVSGCTNNANVAGGNDAGSIVGMVYVLANVSNNISKASSITASGFAAGIVGGYQHTEDFSSLGLVKNTEDWNQAKLSLTNNTVYTPVTITANCVGEFVYDNTMGANTLLSGNTTVSE